MARDILGLDTAKENDPGFAVDLAKKVNSGSKISDLPCVNGVRQSQGEAFSPGIDKAVSDLQSALETMQATLGTAQESLKMSRELFARTQSLADDTQKTLNHFNQDLDLLAKPLQGVIEEIDNLINGNNGSVDPTLRSALRDVTDQLKADSVALQQAFQGKDGKGGLLQLETLFKDTAKSLKRAGDAIASSRVQIQKFSTVERDISKVANTYNDIGEMLKERPQSLVWGPGHKK